MSLVMCEKDKNYMLDSMCQTGEAYKLKVCGLLSGDLKASMAKNEVFVGILMGAGAFGALSNQWCYCGMTERHLNIVVVNNVDVSSVKARFSIPMGQISKVNVKGDMLGRKVITFNIGDSKVKLTFGLKFIGSDLQNQREGVELLCNLLGSR